MKDILSPTHAFLDFDFSEFIDKNFDMSNDILPNTKPLSPSITSSSSAASTTQLDDLFSDTGSTKNDSYLLEQSPSSVYLNNPLWSSIEELAYAVTKKEPPASTSLSCIDTFITDPNSDLIDLVGQSVTENEIFQNLIISSLLDTPLPPQHHHQQQQQQHQQQHHNHLNYYQQQHIDSDLQQKYQQEQRLMELINHKSYQIYPPPKKRKQQHSPSTVKRNPTKHTTTTTATTTNYSSINNTRYTHSDQVNAQLLKELIRQAGRNTKHSDTLSFDATSSTHFPTLLPPDLQYTQMTHGNYHHNPPLSTSHYTNAPNKYSNLPYKIQTNNMANKKPKQQKLAYQQHQHHLYQRSTNKSMYSSDISQAQLLEIQAISRAQQDFIRAREQQEADKGLLIKHHSKKAAH